MNPVVRPKTFVNLYPRLYIDSSDLTLYSGSVYYADVSDYYCDDTCNVYEHVNTYLTSEPIQISHVDSSPGSLGAGEYTFVASEGRFYVKTTGSTGATGTYTIEHRLFDSSDGGNYYSTPTNSSTAEIFYEGNVTRTPIYRQSLDGNIFGYAPAESSTYVSSNTSHYWDRYLYSSIFKNARINIYQSFETSDDIATELKVRGLIDSFSVDNQEISFTIKTIREWLDKKPNLIKFSDVSGGIKDNADLNKYVRKIYGRVNGFVPLNIDYNETASTTVNRDWLVSADPLASHPTLQTFVVAPHADTNVTSTKVTNAAGFCVGDSFLVIDSGVDKYGWITSVNYTTNVISHTAINPRSPTNGAEFDRGFVGAAQVTDTDGTVYHLAISRDWFESNIDGRACFILRDNFEANHAGMTTPFDPRNMQLSLMVYGVKTVPQKPSGGDLGAVNNFGGAYTNPFGLVYQLCSDAIRPEPSSLYFDETSFVAEVAAATELMGFAIPETSTGSLDSYKTYIIKILNSVLGRLYLVDSTTGPKFAVSRVGPMGAADYTLGADEIISYSYEQDYEDAPAIVYITAIESEISKVYATGVPAITSGSSGYDYNTFDHYFEFRGKYARWAYFTSDTLEFPTYLWHPFSLAFAEPVGRMAARILNTVNQRSGRLTVVVKNRFLTADLGDVIQIERDSLPGFDFIYGTNNVRKFVLIEKQQGIDAITMILEDNKAVEDFSGSW